MVTFQLGLIILVTCEHHLCVLHLSGWALVSTFHHPRHVAHGRRLS